MIDKTEILHRIATEEDYIRCPKFGNSLNKFTTKYDNGVENNIISRLLMMSEEEVEKVYLEAVQMLRDDMLEVDEE